MDGPEFYARAVMLALVFLAAAYIRVYLLRKYRWVGVDTFYNFIVAREIRKARRLPQTIDCYLFPEKYDYPPLLHLFLSLFDRGWYQRLQYLAPAMDVASGAVLFAFSLVHFGPDVALIATALYFFTPMAFDSAFSLSARPVANAFMVVAVLALITYFLEGQLLAIALSVAFSVLVLLTHRLTTQSWACVMVSFSLVEASIVPLLVILAAVVIATLLTRFHYLKVLRGHASFLRVFLGKLADPSKRKEMDPLIHPLALLFNVPLVVVLPLLALHFNDRPLQLVITWGISLTVLSVLWVFGQGIRHMGNALPAFSLATAALLVPDNSYAAIMLVLVSLALTVYKVCRLERHPELANYTPAELLDAYGVIKANSVPGDVLLCLPLSFTYNAAYFTGCTVLQSSGGFASGLDINRQLVRMVKEGRVRELIDRYHVRWVLVSGRDAGGAGGREIYRSGAIAVIEIGH